MVRVQGDFKTSKQLRMKCTWFLLPSLAVWTMHLRALEHLKSVSLLDFYSIILYSLKEENFPHMRRHAQKMLVLFGLTYICEQTFSVMKFNKSGYRSSVTDDHLSAVLRISTSDTHPDFSALVQAQHSLDISHWTRKKNRKTANEVVRLQTKR